MQNSKSLPPKIKHVEHNLSTIKFLSRKSFKFNECWLKSAALKPSDKLTWMIVKYWWTMNSTIPRIQSLFIRRQLMFKLDFETNNAVHTMMNNVKSVVSQEGFFRSTPRHMFYNSHKEMQCRERSLVTH